MSKIEFFQKNSILTVIFSYFLFSSALFTSMLNTAKQDEFHIGGTNTESMKKVLEYVYLRTVKHLNEENVYDLYECADYCNGEVEFKMGHS